MAKNKSIPVALFVFNRYMQLAETLECLKANAIPLLYVFADGPRNAADDEAIGKVRSMIDGIGWTEVRRVYHKKNKGLSNSIRDGMNEVFKHHDKAIVLEDDVCVAPRFYSYMLACLNTYDDDPNIAGVTGLRYPFAKDSLNSDAYDVFLTPRFSSWGWGTWRNKWQSISFDINELTPGIKRLHSNLSAGGADLPYAVEELMAGRLTGCWDVYFYINMVLSGTQFVWPKYNYIRNNGLTEGSHASGATPPPWKLEWEVPANKQLKLPRRIKKNDKITKDFLAFFEPEVLTGEVKNLETAPTKLSKGTSMPNLKAVINKLANRAGYHINKLPSNGRAATLEAAEPTELLIEARTEQVKKADPKDYSTTDGPMEVPCQKVVYYHALNELIRPGDKVLDVGSGLGYGMAILSIGASEIQGIDVDSKAVKFAQSEYMGRNPKIKNIQVYNGYKTNFKDNEFDVVTCVDVIEHVENYDRFIDELLRIANRAVIFGTPNRRPEFTNPDGTPKNYWHLREWNYSELNDIMAKHSGRLDWHFIDGPFDGPFKVKDQVSKNTLVLIPIIMKGRNA